MKNDPDFAAKRQLYSTARLAHSQHYVKLDRFCPGSAFYDHDEFWIVTDATGKQFSVYETELTDFCL